MSSFVIEGGHKLSGTIRPQGAKNEALQVISAVLLTKEKVKISNIPEILDVFRELEILTPQWARRLETPDPAPWQEGYRKLLRYFVERYWLQAVSDYDLYSRVKFMVISCLVIRALGGDFLQTAQLYSKEIENNTDNVESLLDSAYGHSAFTDDKLLGLLLK